MAWARVCASCWRQLAEAVLFTPTGAGAEERTPLLGPAPASQSPTPSILRGPGTPNSGFSDPPSGFAGSDPLSRGHREVGLSADSSSPWGPGAIGLSWPTAVLLADLERDARQGECALPGAATAGLAPLKPEASQSSSPGPTGCIRARVEAEAGMRHPGNAGADVESRLPCCHGHPETPEPRAGQLPTAPGEHRDLVSQPVVCGGDRSAFIQGRGDLRGSLEEGLGQDMLSWGEEAHGQPVTFL